MNICMYLHKMFLQDIDRSGKLGLDEFVSLWKSIRYIFAVISFFKIIYSLCYALFFSGLGRFVFKQNYKDMELRLENCYMLFLQSVFKIYDHDNSGHLSSFELRQALTSAGYHVNNKVLESLVLRYGDPQGQVMFDDFIMCAVKLKCMIGKLSTI